MTKLRDLERLNEHAAAGLASNEPIFALDRLAQGAALLRTDREALADVAARFKRLRDEEPSISRTESVWQDGVMTCIEWRSGSDGTEAYLARLADAAKRAASGKPRGDETQELMDFLGAVAEHELGQMRAAGGGCW